MTLGTASGRCPVQASCSGPEKSVQLCTVWCTASDAPLPCPIPPSGPPSLPASTVCCISAAPCVQPPEAPSASREPCTGVCVQLLTHMPVQRYRIRRHSEPLQTHHAGAHCVGSRCSTFAHHSQPASLPYILKKAKLYWLIQMRRALLRCLLQSCLISAATARTAYWGSVLSVFPT